MDLSNLLNVSYIAAGIAFTGAVAYLYFARPNLKGLITKALPFLPGLLRFASTKFEDKKGEFDSHDLFQLSARVVEKLSAALRDTSNTTLEDLKDEVQTAVAAELEIYRKAGVKNVPAADAEDIKSLVDLIFSNVSALLQESPATDEDQPRDNQ